MAGAWYGVQVLDRETVDWLPSGQARTKDRKLAESRYAEAQREHPGGVLRLVTLAGKTWIVTGVLAHVGSVRPSDRARKRAS